VLTAAHLVGGADADAAHVGGEALERVLGSSRMLTVSRSVSVALGVHRARRRLFVLMPTLPESLASAMPRTHGAGKFASLFLLVKIRHRISMRCVLTVSLVVPSLAKM